MPSGIALAYHLLPLELIARHRLEPRIFDRGEKEVQFLFRHQPTVLPVWIDGRLQLVRWGNRRNENRTLPVTGWTWQATVAAGTWKKWQGEPVDIPATMALDNRVWYSVREGLRGILARDEGGVAAVYVVCEPASHYYEVMTRSKWMPVLIGQRI